jgi:oligoendopeptidase F
VVETTGQQQSGETSMPQPSFQTDMNGNHNPELPPTADQFGDWSQVAPWVQRLLGIKLTSDNIDAWLAQWTQLAKLVIETGNRRRVASTVDTTDKTAEQRFHAFLETIDPAWKAADQELKEHLLASGLQPAGMRLPLRKLRAEAALFRTANLPLLAEEQTLAQEYNKIAGAQTIPWEGHELTIDQLKPVLQDPVRRVREQVWRLGSVRQLADRTAFDALWAKLLALRQQIARNADCADYRTYCWRRLHRFDYTPADCLTFHAAIEEVVVPAAERIYERRRQQLKLDTLRPWDLDVDAQGRPPLRPFVDSDELVAKTSALFEQVDPQLGEQFAFMRRMGLLDLDNRKGKAPGGYCTFFPMQGHPFIFMNAVGLARDVEVLLHEAGHAFHNFATAHLPYHQQWYTGAEFAEVASMAMELLAAPYLSAQEGGFYTIEDAARARVEHLERIVLFWPYMAVVDAFQHWVYTHLADAADPAACDAQWSELWQRFMRGVDWGGLAQEMATGWQRKLHIFQFPFYYVEYGLAQLGAVQVWRNAQRNQAEALARYRQSLALGATASLPHLFTAAGARFAFDADTLREAIMLIEQTVEELEQ